MPRTTKSSAGKGVSKVRNARGNHQTQSGVRPAGVPEMRLPVQSECEAEGKAKEWWRRHTYINGKLCELDVGMVEHLTAEGKTLRYSVGVIR